MQIRFTEIIFDKINASDCREKKNDACTSVDTRFESR